MKLKRAGLLTKIVILAALVYAAISMLNLRTKIAAAEADRNALKAQVAQQAVTNKALSDDIARSTDPDKLEEIARNKLGLVVPGEKVFYDTSK